jgi:hypothetical protein
MINTNENKRMAKTPISSTKGLSGAKNPSSGTRNKAKPAIIQAKNNKGLRSTILTPFKGIIISIRVEDYLFSIIKNQDNLAILLEFYPWKN